MKINFSAKGLRFLFVWLLSSVLLVGLGPLPPTGAQVAATAIGFHISGRYLLEANGSNFVMRGMNIPYNWYMEETSSFHNAKVKGSNTVRVVLSSGQNWPKNTAGEVANAISLCKTEKLICVLEVHDTTGYGEDATAVSLAQAVAYWKEIKNVLIGQEAYVIINIGNEPRGNNNASAWINETKSAIADLRSAGFQHTLMIDAPDWGQDWEFVMRDNAASVFNSDPNKNILFSIHMYGVFDTPAKIQNYLATFVNANLPIAVGEFGWQHTDGDPDEDAILSTAQANGIGYMAWIWSGDDYLDIVKNFDPAQETTWGTRLIHGLNGIASTSHEATIYSGSSATVSVRVATAAQGTYVLAPHSSLKIGYAGLNNGPAKVTSTNGVPIVASERVAYSPDAGNTWTSYSELMGFPSNQLTTSYIFPWYNNVDLNTQLRFGNVGTVATTVTVTIGGQIKGTYQLLPNQSTRASYSDLNAGPVKVTSSGNVPIIASERVAYFDGAAWTSFSELMGLPSSKLTTSYTFPWYNNAELNTQLRFGNVGTAGTTVTVTIGGVVQNTYPLGPNASLRVSYPGLNAGPIKVTSSGGVPIIASERVAYFDGAQWTDFSELMGMPTASLSTQYSFPIYNNIDLNTQLRFGNAGTANTVVTVTIGGAVQGTYPLAPNQSTRVSYAVNGGPVVIQSSGNVPIIASERVAYFDGTSWTSFAEMMGLPKEQLTTSYLFPWYNNVDLNTQLRFGVP